MTIFFQHVGERLGGRDFPRTIGTQKLGLKHFKVEDVQPLLNVSVPHEVEILRAKLDQYAPRGFQIWGIPAGARQVLRRLSDGDYILLLESCTPGGRFYYGGEVVAHPALECHALSEHLWGEARFPLIVFTVGQLMNLSWLKFCETFHYSPHWNPAGQTYRDRLKTRQLAFRR